jgi:vacuolar-type H+-ATPase subunit H
MKLRRAASVHAAHDVLRAGTAAPADAAVDDAIRRVLDAEAAAEARVNDAHARAEALREAARTEARAIAARAQRRIVAMRHRFEARTRDDVDRCAQDAPSAAPAPDAALVTRIVASLAADLTGAAG